MTQIDVNPVLVEAAETIQSINPNTGEILGAVPVCGEKEIREAVARARASQPAWAALALRESHPCDGAGPGGAGGSRRRDHRAGLARNGQKRDRIAYRRCVACPDQPDRLPETGAEGPPGPPLNQGLLHITKRTYVVPEPLGVVAVISPYNFPVLLSLQSSFAALLAGNAVVHKPSEYASLTALRIGEILHGAGVPRDLFQVVTGRGEAGRALLRAGVNHVSFVGSSAAGREVAAAAGRQLIPATLELGGNNAMIVLDDAPLSAGGGRGADLRLHGERPGLRLDRPVVRSGGCCGRICPAAAGARGGVARVDQRQARARAM